MQTEDIVVSTLVTIATSLAQSTKAIDVMSVYKEWSDDAPKPWQVPTKEQFQQAMKIANSRRIKHLNRIKDISGTQQGALSVDRCTGFTDKNNSALWECHCQCGSTCYKSNLQLTMGAKYCSNNCPQRFAFRKVRSNSKKAKQPTKEYRTYRSILARCHNPKNTMYDKYGKKGTTMHKAWIEDYNKFLKDVGPAPVGRKASLLRIDKNKDYEPGNCYWSKGTTTPINPQQSAKPEPTPEQEQPAHAWEPEPWQPEPANIEDMYTVEPAPEPAPTTLNIPKTPQERAQWWAKLKERRERT